MKIRPLQDWALIRPKEEAEKTSGGIIIPDAAKEKPQAGEVLAVGKGRYKEERDKKGKVIEKKFVPTVVKPGDRVLYEKYGVTKVELDGEELILAREDHILGWLQ
ncbi:MAG: co-chaperone GroES [Nitrospirae bacterium]|nr:co-chaperone GroES [Nitrospirota bacterium]